MAITAGTGFSIVHENRRFEDYKSLKQFFQNRRRITEVSIEGDTLTDGALAEIGFAGGDIINYIAAEGQAYIRTEANDDPAQVGKYVYLQYQDDTGAIQDWVTADLAADTSDEAAIGSTDFFRVRQMYSEVVSDTGGGKAIVLTDADMGGANDVYGFIDDNFSQFNLERFFTQPNAICDSYLAHVHFHSVPKAVGAGTDTFLGAYICTPRVLNAGEPQVAASKTFSHLFTEELIEEPCILLEGGTEVIFQVGDAATAQEVHVSAILVEVYPDARP